MPWPLGTPTPITITGEWFGVASGVQVVFTPTAPLTDGSTATYSTFSVTSNAAATGATGSGVFTLSQVLPATDDPTTIGRVYYAVTETVDGIERFYFITVPSGATGATASLQSLAPPKG